MEIKVTKTEKEGLFAVDIDGQMFNDTAKNVGEYIATHANEIGRLTAELTQHQEAMGLKSVILAEMLKQNG
jgi:hypothetical protein